MPGLISNICDFSTTLIFAGIRGRLIVEEVIEFGEVSDRMTELSEVTCGSCGMGESETLGGICEASFMLETNGHAVWCERLREDVQIWDDDLREYLN